MAFSLATTACTSHYALTGITRTSLVVDSRYDRQPHAAATAFLAPYKHKVDSVMSPVMGTVAHDMAAERPESDLSNLLADILVWASQKYGEQPVLGIYNMGGIRAALSKGTATYGDVLAVAPFENKIAFVTLTGEHLMELFRQIARRGGEGVSHGTELVITPDGQLLSARLNGNEIDPQGQYRVTTIDYLIQGNDGLSVLSKGTNLNSPQDEKSNSRFIIMDYFKQKTSRHEVVDAQVEGRITIKQ
jgi:2',3'-cyclic-nucleotide 2'-phosphodiesterase (5'-nucleotidase family)